MDLNELLVTTYQVLQYLSVVVTLINGVSTLTRTLRRLFRNRKSAYRSLTRIRLVSKFLEGLAPNILPNSSTL